MAMQTVFAATALLEDGWAKDVLVTIDDEGRIASVTKDAKATPDSANVETLLPAACNLHSHTFQRAMAGLTERRAETPVRLLPLLVGRACPSARLRNRL